MIRRALVAAALAGCSADAPFVTPIVDSPAPGSQADPWTDVERLQLWIAPAGEIQPIRLVQFEPGQPAELSGVPFGDDLVVHLRGFVGESESAYGRTCAFNVRDEASVPDPEPHLYFSRILEWAAGPAPVQPSRVGGVAYIDRDGSAVFVGGEARGDAVDDIDLFDPHVNEFVPLQASSAARTGSVVAQYGDGSALLVGGVNAAGDAVSFYEVLDTPDDSPGRQVTQFDNMDVRLAGHTATSLVDGSIIVIGGLSHAGGLPAVTGEAWSFSLNSDTTPAPPRKVDTALMTPRRDHTATRLGDEVGAGVLVVGGRDASGAAIPSAELYEPLRQSFAGGFSPDLQEPRYGHVAVRIPGDKVLIAGGWNSAGEPARTIELYRRDTAEFIGTDSLLTGGTSGFTATPLADGRVLLAGGLVDGQPVAEAYVVLFDAFADDVVLLRTDDLAVPRAGHAAVLLCDGTVLLVGGTGDPLAPPSERYNPPSFGRE